MLTIYIYVPFARNAPFIFHLIFPFPSGTLTRFDPGNSGQIGATANFTFRPLRPSHTDD